MSSKKQRISKLKTITKISDAWSKTIQPTREEKNTEHIFDLDKYSDVSS